MDETARAELLAAHKAWTEAEKAYSEQASKHVAAWWVDSDEPPPSVEPLTTEAVRKLDRLAADARDKREAYYDLLRRHRLVD